MKKYKNNVISMLLSVIMLLCVMPFSVSAAGSYETSTESQLSMLDSNDYLSSENFTIPNGSYFIKNETLNRYIQPDDSNLNVNLTEMELWNFDGNNYQKWELTNLNNGYYKIISAYSGKALSVKSGEENTGNSRIIQETYGGYYRQQWKIELTVHGMWRISPRSGYSNNWCMSADDGIFFMNGWHIEQKQYTNNTYYRDEWIICQLPTSGSELKYEPSLWNSNPVLSGTNCYSYALNNQVDGWNNSNNVVWLNVGYASFVLTQPYINALNVDIVAKNDASVMGYTFNDSDRDEICSNGSYKIALVIKNYVDYHWYRQNKDGSWSHKLSSNPVTNLDASGEIIYDPENADHDYSPGSPDYTFVKYYRVTPLGYMYNPQKQSTNSSESDYIFLSGIVELEPYKTHLPSEEMAMQIKIGDNLQKINELLGNPQKIVTSGVYAVSYSLSSGRSLIVQFAYIDNNYQVIYYQMVDKGE